VRGTVLRTADLRIQPANMSLAVARATTPPRYTAPTWPGRRPWPFVVALAAAPAAYRCRPSGLKGASHRAGARRPCGPPLTPEASAARRQETRGQAQPAPRHRATPTARATTNSGSGTANCPPHRPGAPNQTGRSVLRGAGPARQIANRHAQPETGLRKLQRLDRPFHMNIHP